MFLFIWGLLGTLYIHKWWIGAVYASTLFNGDSSKHSIEHYLKCWSMDWTYEFKLQESVSGHWHVPQSGSDDLETPREWLCVTRLELGMKVEENIPQVGLSESKTWE